jgi:hypothetical protein
LCRDGAFRPQANSNRLHGLPVGVCPFGPGRWCVSVYSHVVEPISLLLASAIARTQETHSNTAGFIFEEAVANEVERQGFVLQEITRINRHEFDVVTVRDGVIWNVQCKNNFIDLERVESDARRFARYNATLVRSYERALTKDLNREHLLKLRLSLDAVQHMVVSRFPVISDNPRIIPFSRIGSFAAVAESLSS